MRKDIKKTSVTPSKYSGPKVSNTIRGLKLKEIHDKLGFGNQMNVLRIEYNFKKEKSISKPDMIILWRLYKKYVLEFK